METCSVKNHLPRAREFLLDHCGSVAVEFTLIATLLLALIFAIIETGLSFLFGLSLENATLRLARMIQTGQVQKLGISSSADLKSKIMCPADGSGLLPSFVDCSMLVVDLRSASSYSSNPSMGFYKENPQYCVGSAGQVLVLRLAYGMPVFLPPLALGNAVFGASTAGMVNDFPDAVGWTHLLAGGSTFVIENNSYDSSGSNTNASQASTNNSSSPAGCL